MTPMIEFKPEVLFITANEAEAERIRTSPCCGVLAVAICSKKPFTEVWDLIKKNKGVGHQWRGRTYLADLAIAFVQLQVAWKLEPRNYMTLAKWVDQHAVKSQMYLVATGRHYQVVARGVVMDQRGAKPINEYWGRRKMVSVAWRIK